MYIMNIEHYNQKEGNEYENTIIQSMENKS